MAARDWNEALGRNIPGDKRDMRARSGVGRSLLLPCGKRIELTYIKNIIERNEAVGSFAAIAADIRIGKVSAANCWASAK